MTYRDVPSYAKTCQLLGIRLTPKQRRAFWYLERHGKRFCVDFGTRNAETQAAQLRAELFAKRMRDAR